MAPAVKTTAQELADSRVRLEVEVPPEEVKSRLDRKARALGSELRLPGFRRGKVPVPVVIQRLGREAVLEQAVRDSLSSWYASAIETAEVVPVGDPKLELAELPAEGEPLRLSIEIGVLPKAQLGAYRGVEVPRREPAVGEEQISEQVEAMRDRLARLHTAERPVQLGDFVVIDYVVRPSGDAPPGEGERQTSPAPAGEGRDQLVEIGAGRAVDGLERGLVGASAGDQRTVQVSFPLDHADEQLAGRAAALDVTVKEVKFKELPAVDEDFAIDAGYDSVEELRGDLSRRLLEVDEERVEGEFRQAALDAVVKEARVAVTPELARARAKEMWERMLHGLAHRGISREAYLRVVGRQESEILAELEPEAEQALRREAVLTAIVEAEAINPSDEELAQALAPAAAAEEQGVEADRVLADLRSAGRLEEAREDLAARRALDLIAVEGRPISVARAQAKERLWTPDQASGERPAGERTPASAGAQPSGPGGLWTPSDQ